VDVGGRHLEWQGEAVEIYGVDRLARVLEGPARIEGKDVDPNGKWGVAEWDWGMKQYKVRTFDGLVIAVPEANLRRPIRMQPEEAGFDLSWNEGEEFATEVCEVVWRKGYCLIQLPDAGEMRSKAFVEASKRDDYALFPEEIEELYLGRAAASKVAWLGAGQGEKTEVPDDEDSLATSSERSVSDALTYYGDYNARLSEAMAVEVTEYFGFLPWGQTGTLLRAPLNDEDERQELRPSALSDDSIEDGSVEGYLKFIQRRRLCMICFISGDGGSIELSPHSDSSSPSKLDQVSLPVRADRLLVFRNDKMTYTYRSGGLGDLALQSWYLEELEEPLLQRIEGQTGAMERILGNGPPAHTAGVEQIHFMGIAGRLAGETLDPVSIRYSFTLGADGMVVVPMTRWDFEPYWEPDPSPLSGKGKSRHCGFLHNDCMRHFDHAFFGIAEAEANLIPPCFRNMTETAYEVYHDAGLSMQKVSRSHISLSVGDTSTGEFDQWYGYHSDPDSWKRQCGGWNLNKASRIAFTFNTTGPTVQLDTACSASLVSLNVNHATLRSNTDIKMGINLASGAYTQPWGFIGLSQAGMLGPTGRVKFSDQSADGFCRGEGSTGAFILKSDELEATRDRYAAIMGTFINQDGRSASLTAPNGPSQQLCERASIRDGGLVPEDFAFHENHGTGTALGDPIEIGSVRAVFVKRVIPEPLDISSAKTHTGHLEGGAGAMVMLQVIMKLTYASCAPNCHLKQGNHHIETDGFPVLFCTEMTDLTQI